MTFAEPLVVDAEPRSRRRDDHLAMDLPKGDVLPLQIRPSAVDRMMRVAQLHDPVGLAIAVRDEEVVPRRVNQVVPVQNHGYDEIGFRFSLALE